MNLTAICVDYMSQLRQLLYQKDLWNMLYLYLYMTELVQGNDISETHKRTINIA